VSLSQPASRAANEPLAHVADARCPWCDQPISHEKFHEIHAQIEAKERERSAEVERHLKEQIDREKSQAEAKAKAEVAAAQKAAAETIEKAKQEATKKEIAAREETRKATEAAMAQKIAEAEQGKKAAEQQLKEQREALEKANVEAVNAEKAKAFETQNKLQEKLKELQRQLEKKTAEDLGEGAEVDLFEAIKREFPHDRVTRVNKGTAGADIIHNVVHNNKVCGCIIYDSKNRNAWRNDYVTKLREDQLSAQADHAILSTMVFPAGARQLYIQDGVIVVNPARAVELAKILRKQVLQMHTLNLSNKARDEKTARLYEFITSDRCSQLIDRMETFSEDMLELDVKEKKAHDATWKRRGELLRSVQRAHGEFSAEIERIIGTAEDDGEQ
jgi:hypothetical protein